MDSVIILSILPPLFICAVLLLIISALFTQKGKNLLIRLSFGKIIKDYGDMGTSKMRGSAMTQTAHLYQCENAGETFFVLEGKMFLRAQFIKISTETAHNLIAALSSQL